MAQTRSIEITHYHFGVEGGFSLACNSRIVKGEPWELLPRENESAYSSAIPSDSDCGSCRRSKVWKAALAAETVEAEAIITAFVEETWDSLQDDQAREYAKAIAFVTEYGHFIHMFAKMP